MKDEQLLLIVNIYRGNDLVKNMLPQCNMRQNVVLILGLHIQRNVEI